MTKTIYITGASRGIGRATAILCGERGWSVAINYNSDAEAAEETVQAVEKAGGKASAIRADISEEDGVVLFFDEADALFGCADGVVNNAGIVGPAARLVDIELARMERMFRVNAIGALLVAREAARRLTDGGSLVNVSSVAAVLGAPNEYIDYAATKGAVDSMTVGLATELAPRNVRVNCVRPGITLTDMNVGRRAHDPNRAERVAPMVPLQRAGTAPEIGEAIVWLLSDAASYITGTFINASGGR
ncbi:MAG: SDR family oxidoreductase [Pseudomonadota bacterium]